MRRIACPLAISAILLAFVLAAASCSQRHKASVKASRADRGNSPSQSRSSPAPLSGKWRKHRDGARTRRLRPDDDVPAIQLIELTADG